MVSKETVCCVDNTLSKIGTIDAKRGKINKPRLRNSFLLLLQVNGFQKLRYVLIINLFTMLIYK